MWTAEKKAKTNGQMFESIVDYSSRQYERAGIAKIQKTPEPFHMTSRERGKVIGYFESKAQVDYKGTLRGGQSILFEAKHFTGANMPFERVKPHQEAQLLQEWELGAKAFVLVSHELKDYYRIPIKDWVGKKKSFEKKSMNLKDLEFYRVENQGEYVKFLDGIAEEAVR